MRSPLYQEAGDFINSLDEVYRVWLASDYKAEKINHILPYIQTAGFYKALFEIREDEKLADEIAKLDKILASFRYEFQAIYDGVDVAVMGASDFAPDVMAELERISKEGGAVSDDLQTDLLAHELKYEHAHVRVAYNYGKFFQDILAHYDSFTEEEKVALKANLVRCNSLAEMVAASSDFELEKKSTYLVKDDLENHALLNQISNYNDNLGKTLRICQTPADKEQFKIFIVAAPSSEVIEVKTATYDFKEDVAVMAKADLEMFMGFEAELILRETSGETAVSANIANNIRIKKVLADLNARRFMQTKYGIEPTVAEIADATRLLAPLEEAEITARLSDNGNLTAILKNLAEHGYNEESNPGLRAAVANLSAEEIYFYRILFIDKVAGIELEGLNELGSEADNYLRLVELIQTGRMHETILDMIRACEISIGVFPVAQAQAGLDKTLARMKAVATECDLVIAEPNVQVNMSVTHQGKHVLMPQIGEAIIIDEDEHEAKTAADSSTAKTITISALGREILRLVQEAVVEANASCPFLRGQHDVGTLLDRKKGMGENLLGGSPYFEVRHDNPAFLNHKILAAKNSTLRFSIISNDAKIAVVEVRLIGNNPHFAYFMSAESMKDPAGLTYIPNVLLPVVTRKLAGFCRETSAEEMTKLHAEHVMVNPDGTVSGLEPTLVVDTNAKIAATNKQEMDEHTASVVEESERTHTRVVGKEWVKLVADNTPKQSCECPILF